MKYSENYEFNLPTAEDDTLADIGVISQNFEKIDEVMKKNENLGVELNRFEAETMDAVGRLNTKDTDLQSQIDTAKTDISTLKTKDTNLQSQIDTDKADIAELKAEDNNLQSQIDDANADITDIQESVHSLDMELDLTKANLDKVEARMGSWYGSGTLYDMVKVNKTDIATLKTTDENLQSQIDALGDVDVSEIQSQLDAKVDKVEGKGLSTNDYDDSAEEKVSKIGNTNLIPSDSRYIVRWIQDVYDSVFTSSADNICLADRVTAEISHRQSGDENLQSQIDTAKTDISALKTKDTNLQSQIDTKVDKVEGKGLSTNDYDDTAKEKVTKIGNVSKIPTDSRYIVQWIQDVYDSVFKSSADNTCLADKVTAEVASRQSADTHLQSQLDTANTDIVEIQESVHNLDIEVDLTKSNLDEVEARMGSWAGSGNLYDMVKAAKTDISALKTKDTNLQSQIDTKVTRKVAVVGSDTVNSDGWYKVASGTMTKYQVISLLFAVHTPATSGKYSGILQLDLRGGDEAILTGDELKLGWLVRAGFDLSQVLVKVDGYNWALYYNLRSNQNFRVFFEVIQESSGTGNKATYNLHIDSAIESTAPLATATSTDLGTVNTANKLTTARNINGIAFDGSADINITANDIASTSGPEHNLAYEIGMTKAYLSAVEASIGTWNKGETISDTISELQESTLDLDRKVTSTQTDLNAVKARIGSWGASKTLYDMIVDLTARIEALENSAS